MGFLIRLKKHFLFFSSSLIKWLLIKQLLNLLIKFFPLSVNKITCDYILLW
jgi:hypothetical protein